MKLASFNEPSCKDGKLFIVDRDLSQMTDASDISPHLLHAIENWSLVEPKLQARYEQLIQKKVPTQPYDETKLLSALPRTWLFADGSAFIHHIKLVRKARNAPLPETLLTVPLMYQGESGRFLSPKEDIPQINMSHGTDFEAEVGVITDFVPMGTSPEKALNKILLVVLINDVSLRGLIPDELAQGFGFFHGKPASTLSPVAVTPDELGSAWKSGRVHLPLTVHYNQKLFGQANGSEMHFHFGQLIAHAAKTRDLQAGTLVGSGTFSNENSELGSGCLAELRTLEQLNNGKPSTPFMKVGDTVKLEMLDQSGRSIFGKIEQRVSSYVEKT